MTILIVDDEPQVLRYLSTVFKGAGYDVGSVASVGEAIAFCANVRPDVVLADYKLGELSGTDFTKWMADHYPEVPCAIMTGWPDGSKDSPKDGCSIIQKPFDAATVLQFIHSLLLKRKPPV